MPDKNMTKVIKTETFTHLTHSPHQRDEYGILRPGCSTVEQRMTYYGPEDAPMGLTRLSLGATLRP